MVRKESEFDKLKKKYNLQGTHGDYSREMNAITFVQFIEEFKRLNFTLEAIYKKMKNSD